MHLFRILFAALFLFQAAGLSELLCAAEASCEQACAAEAGHADEGAEHHEESDAACQWHCLACVHAGLQAQAASSLLLPQSHSNQNWSGPIAFVPAAPCASIFHPPA